MSNLNNTLAFESKVSEEGFGVMIISGIIFPSDRIDPLSKIWSSVRKRISERYDVDVAGTFIYNPERALALCTFLPSYVNVKESAKEKYKKSFIDSFSEQMKFFKDVLEAFMADHKHGYYPYCECVSDGIDYHFSDAMLDLFLTLHGIKTQKDQEEKDLKEKRRLKRLQECE